MLKYKLKEMSACNEAIGWVGDRTPEQAWNECERGDWMLWIAQKKDVDLRKLTLAKARCSKLAIHLMKDERSRKAVEVAERFGLGLATIEELDEARNAAADADADADAYAAAGAAAYADYADAAAYAASAAAVYAAAGAAAYAADAYAADAYAADAGAAAARKNILKQCADICREILSDEIMEESCHTHPE